MARNNANSKTPRESRPSTRQREADENKAEAAAKKDKKKKKAQDATAKKAKQASNNARAAVLRDATNVASGELPHSRDAQIAELTAKLKSAETQVEILGRKNKKLAKTVRQTQTPAATDSGIIPIPKSGTVESTALGWILVAGEFYPVTCLLWSEPGREYHLGAEIFCPPSGTYKGYDDMRSKLAVPVVGPCQYNKPPPPPPRGKFNIQSAMGLEDDRALFVELQAGIHVLAHEAKVDFDSNWSQQDHSTIAKITRVAEQRHKYLTSKRFLRSWATSAMVQRYLNSVHAYKSGKANPASGVNRRRERVTRIGRLECQRAARSTPAGDDDESNEPEEMNVDVQDDHLQEVEEPGICDHNTSSSSSSDEDEPDVINTDSPDTSDDEGNGGNDDDEDGTPGDGNLPVAKD
ncbi:hypothetical protein C8R45DRAFT_937683 [Mycena sanguinolenta]|nr:hypothetical protein C8R45DRAFT_937683 [Mycena sanguinolenta]